MAKSERLYDSLTKKDLKQLRELAVKEHEEFVKRNPGLKSAYYTSLIGICLCQGGFSLPQPTLRLANNNSPLVALDVLTQLPKILFS
jgi:hypothetical protein